MAKRCSSCNAALDDGMKLCPNCGRLISSIGDRHELDVKRRASSGRRPANVQRPQAEGSVRRASAHKAQKEKAAFPWGKLALRLALVAALLAAIYALLFSLEVVRVRRTGYEFDTPMKLSCETFGEAFDSSVENGSWSFNIFTFTVSYSGEHNGDDITVKFSALADVKVKEVEIDENVKTDKEQIDTYLMGLFM